MLRRSRFPDGHCHVLPSVHLTSEPIVNPGQGGAGDCSFRLAVFLARVHNRLVRSGLPDILTDHDPDTALRREFRRLDAVIEADARKHRLIA